MTTSEERDVPVEAGAGDADPARTALLDLAAAVRRTLDAWGQRMTQAATSGRGATTGARMATARAAAEMRHFTPPPHAAQDDVAGLQTQVADYLRRARAAVNNAAREIERNRYSLPALQAELERLEQLYRRLTGAEAETAGAAAEGESSRSESGAPPRGADDRGAEREVGAQEQRPLEGEDRPQE